MSSGPTIVWVRVAEQPQAQAKLQGQRAQAPRTIRVCESTLPNVVSIMHHGGVFTADENTRRHGKLREISDFDTVVVHASFKLGAPLNPTPTTSYELATQQHVTGPKPSEPNAVGSTPTPNPPQRHQAGTQLLPNNKTFSTFSRLSFIWKSPVAALLTPCGS